MPELAFAFRLIRGILITASFEKIEGESAKMSVLDFGDKQIQVKDHIMLNGRTHGQQKFDAI